MKLIIQIPCYNEEKTLPYVLEELPKKIDGIDIIETQIIDDGSTDKTVEVAKKYNVDHIITYIGNRGLGYAFKTGIENALKNGADIIVNTDGDNQYPGKYIKDLVKPIIENKADIVIGNRQTSKVAHFSILKKFLQWLGSGMVRFLSETTITDTVSGFRAYSRDSLLKINIVSRFSYVLDTIIQAGKKGFILKEIIITTNPPTRKSRLFKNIWEHIKKSTAEMIRIYAMHEPLKIFLVLSIPSISIGTFGVLRFLYYYFFTDINPGMLQSLIISGIAMTIGISLISMGIIGDLISKSRMIQEDILYLNKIAKYGETDYEIKNKK